MIIRQLNKAWWLCPHALELSHHQSHGMVDSVTEPRGVWHMLNHVGEIWLDLDERVEELRDCALVPVELRREVDPRGCRLCSMI